MTKMNTELSYLTVKNLKPKYAPYEVVEGTSDFIKRGSGRLLIRVRPTGTKEWYFRYKHVGKIVYFKVGTFPSCTVSDARMRYKDLSSYYQLDSDVKGRLIREDRKQKRVVDDQERQNKVDLRRGSLKQLTDGYVSSLRVAKKRSADEAESIFERYVYRHQPEIENVKANLVTKDDIRDLLARMIQQGITTQANRTRSYLHAAFQHGLRQDNDPLTFTKESVQFHLEVNPVSAIPRQKSFETPGDRVLSAIEIRDLWSAFSCQDNRSSQITVVMNAFICFVIAVGGQRILELLRTEWAHLADDRQAIVIPKANSKTGRVHAVPLSSYAIDILAELKSLTGGGKYIFPGRGLGNNVESEQHIRSDSVSRTIARYRMQHAEVEPFNLQDLRRTVKTVLGEQGVDKQIRDRLQNHAFLDVSSVHYDRYDYFEEKKYAVSVWDSYLRKTLNSHINILESDENDD